MLSFIRRLFKKEELQIEKLEEGLTTERSYQKHVNEIFQGLIEHRLPDATRVDIVTDDLAIEIDFARKWYEAIGQACHYGSSLKKKPAILLIVRSPEDEKYVAAAKRVCSKTKISIDGQDYHIVLFVYRDIKG